MGNKKKTKREKAERRMLGSKEVEVVVLSPAKTDEIVPVSDSALTRATPRRKKNVPEVMTPLSIRLRRSVHVRFIAFADERNLSYPEALTVLLEMADAL